ncbi:MAG: hypothetical protein HZC25_10065 [Rhodospirillales bacterium]|nr:hypothetical protein [Rhodospirillales bacterium]
MNPGASSSLPLANPPPYLSTVVTSRNDDHGGNLLRRMQIFVDAWFEQVRRHRLDAELIVVEWNPPPERPPLAQALRWPSDLKPGEARVIVVPAALHARYAHADRLPLYQFIAKNAGIRRARGQFVLATNIDILLSSELAAFLAEKSLDPAIVYRNDRIDVSDAIVALPDGADYLGFCNEHPIRINGPTWTVDLRDGRIHQVFLSQRFEAITRFFARLSHGAGLAGRLVRLARMIAGVRRGLPPQGPPLSRRLWQTLGRAAPAPRPSTRSIPAHVNACGDFTLMAKSVWESLRGHPEYDGYSMHLDSIVLLAALASGLVREEVLPYPMRHFHIDHSAGSGYTPEAEAKLFARLRAKGIPYLSWDEVERLIQAITVMPDRVRYNDDHWGLGNQTLAEILPAPSGQDP